MAEEIKESTDFDQALSASLDSFFESDCSTKEDASAEEKKIFAETVTYEETVETEVEDQSQPEDDEPAPEEVQDIDDNVFNNIDSALASQIAVEIKKEKRLKAKRRPKWWLLSLIPVLGIFIIFIGPVRKYMPKWFMALRTLVFSCFAVAVLAVVATEGQFACAVAVKSIKNSFGTALEKQTDLSSELKNISFIEGTRVENKRLHLLCVLRDENNVTKMLALATTDSEYNTLDITFLDNTTELSKLTAEIDGWILLNPEVVKIIIDRVGGMEVVLNTKEADFINSKLEGSNLKSGRQTLGGEAAAAYFLCDSETGSCEEGFESLVSHQSKTIQLVHDFLEGKSLHVRFFMIRQCVPYIQTNLPEGLMVELMSQTEFSLLMTTQSSDK